MKAGDKSPVRTMTGVGDKQTLKLPEPFPDGSGSKLELETRCVVVAVGGRPSTRSEVGGTVVA